MRRIVLIFIAAVLIACLCGCGEEKTAENEDNEMLGYITTLCPGEDNFWVVAVAGKDGVYYNQLYRITESGKEEFVCRLPWYGIVSAWNRERESFFFISVDVLYEYDPVTEAMAEYEIPEGFEYVNYADGEHIYLTDRYSGDIRFSVESGEIKELDSMGSGAIIKISGEYAFSKGSNTVSCYDLTDNKLLWEIEGDSICESGGKAYISHRDRSGVYMLEPKENTQPVLTEVGTRTRAVADAGDYVVCATTGYKSIIFVALYPDGTEVEIGVMEVSDPNRYGLSMMEIWNGKLFFAITSEDGLFCCDLI